MSVRTDGDWPATGRRAVAGFIAGQIAAEFPAYAVTVHPNRGGLAFHAVRHEPAGSALFAVVTADENELRAALASTSMSLALLRTFGGLTRQC